MATKNPIIAITGSSGAGTSTVMNSFKHIFHRKNIKAHILEGDSMHKYDRVSMKAKIAEEEAKGNRYFSHFGPDANVLDELENIFKEYKSKGKSKYRYYIHNDEEGKVHNQASGTFTPWKDMEDSDLLFYEGLHGGYAADKIDVAGQVDLLVGVVPIVNLEWIQKIHRDNAARGYSEEAIVDTILRRMPDYTKHICPQFSRTDINFQRISTIDTSNPFIARDIPTPDESFVIIRFKDTKNIDFQYLLSMINGSFMSNKNNIVVPGGKMGLAMELIFSPIIHNMIN
jgi:phosphoribulokinase